MEETGPHFSNQGWGFLFLRTGRLSMMQRFKSFPSLVKGPKQAIRLVLVLAVCLLGFIQVVTVDAQGLLSEEKAVRKPLGELLTPEGRLNLTTGFRGALDPSGWRMKYGPDGGPLFEPTDARLSNLVGNWDNLGDGVSSRVHAIAVDWPNVYVGGYFTYAGGNYQANYIARWDGTNWQALGSGLNGAVYAIAVEGPNVYVGGYFTNAGGNPNANYIARWDGTNWQALGSGLNNGAVYAIAVDGANIYVGGYFHRAGENPNANYIARWDGTSWQALGSGLNSMVYAIAVEGPNVYVGGAFTDWHANHVGRWDGTNWNNLGGGMNGDVNAIAVKGTNVYAGGWFTNAGGNPNAKYIARWDGTNWQCHGQRFE